MSSIKAKLVAFFGLLASLALVYFIGRRNRKGEVNVAVAQRELELANKKHEQLQSRLDALETKRINIAADIIEEGTARVIKEAGNEKLTDDQVVERLRLTGIIK